MMPYPPSFSSRAASSMEPAIGASTWASWRGGPSPLVPAYSACPVGVHQHPEYRG